MNKKDEDAARCAAAHNAYRIVQEFGVADGTMLLRAVCASYLRALAAVDGWPAALELVRQQLPQHAVPGGCEKLRVVVDNTAAQ